MQSKSHRKRNIIILLIVAILFLIIFIPLIIPFIGVGSDIFRIPGLLGSGALDNIPQNKCLQSINGHQDEINDAKGKTIKYSGRVVNTCNTPVINPSPRIVTYQLSDTKPLATLLPQRFQFQDRIDARMSTAYEFTLFIPDQDVKAGVQYELIFQ